MCETVRTVGRGCACPENNGGADVHGYLSPCNLQHTKKEHMKYSRVMMVSMLVNAAVCATEYTWLPASGTASFQTAANWSPTGLPGAADKVKFDAAGTYGVTLAGDVNAFGATVGASGAGSDVTFDLGGYTWQMTNTLSFSNTGTARFGGGTVTFGYTHTNNTSVTPSTGQKLVLNSGSALFSGNLGTSTNGAIEVNGGDHVLSWAMPLYPPPAGGASFRMTGGRVSMTNEAGLGRCTMNSGSRIALEGGTFTVRYAVDVYGTPSAPSVIDIYTNAMLFMNKSGSLTLSRTSGGLGIVNIRGGSLILSNSAFSVVNVSTAVSTTGMVNLVDGKFYALNLTLGATSNAVALVRQSGGQLLVSGTTAFCSSNSSLGVLTQEGGEAWYNAFYVGNFSKSVGEVNLTGGRLAVGGSSAVGKGAGSTGRLLQTGGELSVTNAFSVGNAAGAFGVVTNTGGSFWLNNALNLGNSGAGAFGRAYFSGLSNYVKSAINVGSNTTDSGELIVAGGSLVSDGAVTVGNTFGSTGLVSIIAGTSLFKGLTVAQSGQGALFISGGVVAVTNGGAFVAGNATGSLATVVISGGTNLFAGQLVTFGQYGSASVRITGGYTYSTNRMVVGSFDSSTGRVELVDGVLATPIIDGRIGATYSPPGGRSEILFDGGTLQHSVDGDSWMPSQFVTSFSKATLTERGAVIDSNGGVLIIPQALSNEVGQAGRFTKKGAGQLTLSAYNGFTGRVAVETGELAVTGAIYLSGGVAINDGAILNLASAAAVYGLTTAPGTVSQIDGALTLKSGVVLTNGVGASLGGSGVVTGSVVFAAGSAWASDKSLAAAPLQVTAGAVFQSGATVQLTGYTEQDLAAGIPLMQAGAGATIQVPGRLPVTLDGASDSTWWTGLSSDGKTLSARRILVGTLIKVL